VFLVALFCMLAATASAQTSPTQTAEHEPGLDTVSGADGPNPNAPAGATPEESVANQFPENSVETFRFEVGAGERNGSFTVEVGWPLDPGESYDANIDFDIYVYRIRDGGTPADPSDDTLDPNVIASAASLDNPEFAEYTSQDPDQPLIREDEYIVAVHNYCSQTSDLDVGCEGLPDQPADEEDRWEAVVTFSPYEPANVRPSVTLTGPTEARTGQPLTYAATASDPDSSGPFRYAFDLNGDGVHETPAEDSGTTSAAATSFSEPGTYTVGVRVIDSDGSPAYASLDVRVSGPPVAGTAKRKLLQSFRLNRPVFGGRKRNRLVIRYRLREASRVTLTLYRGSKRIRRLSRGNRVAGRTYTVRLRPRKLKRGATYTVRLSAVSADRTATQRVRLAAKRL
jgi:hypothetical protein